ncbi:hypothetical protein QBC39DRAFT_331667 [Podospora conica]|nr:hypothetical protein QBC39DRAFT_331667 [Schizothecium conicum]
MSTNKQSPVPGARSSSREPLTATPDPIKGVCPAASTSSTSSDRSRSIGSEADSVFSASSRPTNQTTPEYSDIESKTSAVQAWATAQSPGAIAGDELASRLSAAAAGQQTQNTSTSITSPGKAPPLMTSALPTKAFSPKPSPEIPAANPPASPKEEIRPKTIIKLKRCIIPDKPVKKYTSKKKVAPSDLYDYPQDSDSDEPCPTNRLKPSKKSEERRAKKLKPTPSTASSATLDHDSSSESSKKTKQPRAKKPKPAPVADSDSEDSGSEYVPRSKTAATKKRKPSAAPEKEQQPATKKPKTKASPPSPTPSSSTTTTTLSAASSSSSSSSSSARPKQHYQPRAAEILRSPLEFDDCVRDDTRPGKAQRIRRLFRRFRRDQGEPVSTEIAGARNPPDPKSAMGGKGWGEKYKAGGDGIIVGWEKNKARRIWGGGVNSYASEYAKKH